MVRKYPCSVGFSQRIKRFRSCRGLVNFTCWLNLPWIWFCTNPTFFFFQPVQRKTFYNSSNKEIIKTFMFRPGEHIETSVSFLLTKSLIKSFRQTGLDDESFISCLLKCGWNSFCKEKHKGPFDNSQENYWLFETFKGPSLHFGGIAKENFFFWTVTYCFSAEKKKPSIFSSTVNWCNSS